MEGSSDKKPKLLVAEDDYENQRFLELFLRRKFDVTVCDSAQTFYKCLENSKFEIILMDISLKGSKNGLDLTKELRIMDEYKDIPIICLSAHAYQKDKESAFKAGVDIFLTKPVENVILMNSLLDAVNKKKLKV